MEPIFGLIVIAIIFIPMILQEQDYKKKMAKKHEAMKNTNSIPKSERKTNLITRSSINHILDIACTTYALQQKILKKAI